MPYGPVFYARSNFGHNRNVSQNAVYTKFKSLFMRIHISRIFFVISEKKIKKEQCTLNDFSSRTSLISKRASSLANNQNWHRTWNQSQLLFSCWSRFVCKSTQIKPFMYHHVQTQFFVKSSENQTKLLYWFNIRKKHDFSDCTS